MIDCRYLLLIMLWLLCAMVGHAQVLVEPQPLNGHTATVTDIAYSDDCRTLASASQDGTVRIWDLDQAREIAALRHDDRVVFVEFLGSDRVATVTETKENALQEVKNRRQSVGSKSECSIWDVKSGQRLLHLQDLNGAVFDTDAASGRLALVMKAEGPRGTLEVRLIDAQGRSLHRFRWEEPERRFDFGWHNMSDLRFLSGGELLAAMGPLEGGSKGNVISVVQTDSGQVVQRIKAAGVVQRIAGGDGGLIGAVVAPSRRTTISDMRILQVWRAKSGELVAQSEPVQAIVSQLTFVGPNKLGAKFYGRDATAVSSGVALLNVARGGFDVVSLGDASIHGDATRGNWAYHLFTAPQSQPVMAVGIGKTVELYDGEYSRRIGQLHWPTVRTVPTCFMFSRDGQWLVSGVEVGAREEPLDKLLWVWDLRDKLLPSAVGQPTGSRGE